MTGSPEMIGSLDVVTDRYAAILCDVWGVLHNGVDAFPESAEALRRARQKGLAVVLITNSPRPRDGVEAQLAALGVPQDAWDRIVTSGDVTRDLIRQAPRKLFHLGPERDEVIYDGIDCELVEEFEADAVVCTGLFDDETETPEEYAELLMRLRSRNLPFICANPDIMVERGDRLIWCAGALARDYTQLGGRTLISGKPHRPIYVAALNAASEVLGREVSTEESLGIGDGMLTDIKGAADNGLDVLYVSGGVHAADYGNPQAPDLELLSEFLEKHGHRPVAVIPRLR
ncbi:HAD superfamily hydrolase (TIGR01459 family) [Pseudaminobacter salicylatoxidans]|uniref:HAD superfamily hydrolase (TIGR01459 family) n=1 Tax=Pseudaminobacter salicylatoxidans TaxID=93369 RepID=A0A316BXD4_PSESE|nr:TIGR01459 family HAD-type hydrolase [Pseudaminobacter salicylatoxidans]PWJ76914.1 HAD superfamily hydrolase (TIGR01459 family) [Pseudaminobacter salicylatoxidans]